MDDLVAQGLAAVLRLDPDLTVFAEPPEASIEPPTAVVLSSTGGTGRDSFRGGWGAEVVYRVGVYVSPRTELEEAVRDARPWVGRVLRLFATHDVLAATEGEEEIAEVLRVTWTTGVLPYAGQDYAGVDFRVTCRVDWQVLVGCGKIGG